MVLGLTKDNVATFPGMVAMSKSVQPEDNVSFSQTDLFGTWRVYVQRVHAKLAGSTTQVGTMMFSPSGIFVNGQLIDAAAPPANTNLTAGSLLVAANGSVTGTLTAGTLATSDQYKLIGSMRKLKDVITGVLTANLSSRTTTHYGLVTLVRDVTLFDLSQPSYTVTEGNSLVGTVKRTGNLTAPASVNWAANTSTPTDFIDAPSGTLSFPAMSASQMFTLKTRVNSLVDGNRSATIVLSNPAGPGAMLGSLTSAPLSIIDEDKAGTVKLSAGTYSVPEAAKTAPIVIQRSGSNLASNVVVQFQLTDGTAQAGRDYTVPANTSVTFAAGATSLTVQVPIPENALVDGPRTFTFALTGISPVSGVIGSPPSALVTIGDNDLGGTLQFSTAAYSVGEGNQSTITVLRGGGAAGGVLVDFATSDGSARAGHNYNSSSGTLTFESSNTSKTFTIQTLNDGLIEGDNTVLLTLSNVRSSSGFGGAGVPVLGALKSAVLIIKDSQKGVQFTSSNYSASETAAMATITLIRTGPLTDTATVRYSTSDGTAVTGVNYVPASGVVTFAPNIATQSFPVKVLPDKVSSGPRTVLLLLSNNASVGLGPRSSAVLTIGDADTGGVVKFSAAAFSVNESAGNAVITVTRSGGTAGAVTVKYATADQPCALPPCPGLATSEDYTPQTGTLTFGPGETTKTFQVPITNDLIVEGNETFLVTLSDVQGGATLGTPSQAVVTIVDDDASGAVQLSAAAYTVNEPAAGSNTSVNVTVTRTGVADGASVTLLTGIGTAVSGVNYMPVATTLVFDAGVTSKIVPITVLGDGAPTGDLTVPILLTAPGNGATLGAIKNATLTIVDANRSVRFSASTYSVNEGSPVTVTALRGGSTAGTITVPYQTIAGSATALDFTNKSGVLTFAAGVTSQSFTVTTAKRAGDNGNRSFTVTLGTPNPNTVGVPVGTATVNIADIDRAGSFQFSPTTYTVVEGSPATLTVVRSGGSLGAFNVPFSVSGPGAANISPVSGNFSFAAGMTSKTFMVNSVTNTLVDGNRSITLALGTPIPTSVPPVPGVTVDGATTATLNIVDNDNGGIIQFAAATQTVAETSGTVSVPVTRGGPNLAGGILVDYTISGDTNATLSPLTGTLTFAAAAVAPAPPLTLTIVNSPAAQLDRSLVVTLSNPRSSTGFDGSNRPVIGALGNTSVKITDTLPRVQFSAPVYTVTEGDPAQITITRIGATPTNVTVQFATADGTAVADTDYTNSSSVITVTGAGRTVSIPTVHHGGLDGTKTVLLSLASTGTASVGTPSTAVLNILDRQSAGTLSFATPVLSVLEGGTARVTVTRSGSNLVGNVSVDWSATGGNALSPDDFTPASGTLSFGPGVSSQTFDITAVDDGVPEGTESIILSLDAPTGGAVLGGLSSMTLFVIDKQQTVGFARDVSVSEKVTPGTVQVVRSGVPSGIVSVTATTVDGTAVAGQDYVFKSQLITFGPGEIAKPFDVQILTGNASTRNGNRALSIVLSNPVNAALNAANVSTLTILDGRPDLIIASVSAPTSTLTGKAVSTPSTVRNIGPVAVATPFSIGLYLVRASDFDPNNPRAGALVASQEVSGLAAGASAAFPTQVMLDDTFPAGSYYLSAVANFDDKVSEADTGNNGRSSFPAAIEVKKNLTKFKSASAAFSQTDLPSGSFAAPAFPILTAPDPGPCDVTGSVNLTGTFAISSQQGSSATGQATLTGSLNDEPVQYVLLFTGTGDDNGNVTATVNSVTFRSLVRTLTGTGTGSLVGTLNGRLLSANVSGQFVTSTGGGCLFTGTLQAQAQTSFAFRVGAGTGQLPGFGFGTTPSDPVFPVTPSGVGAELQVFFDSDFPDPKTVLFTGPAGSGITSKPADEEESHVDDEFQGRYRVIRDGASGFPGGKWTVSYKGQPKTFTLPPFNGNASFVLVFPTVVLDTNGNLTRVDWVYRNRLNGSVLSGPPAFMAGITVRVGVNDANTREPESDVLSPATMSFDLAAAGFAPVPFTKVRGVQFEYVDLGGNLIIQDYGKAFSIQLEPRVENTYLFASPNGQVIRELDVFVDVPANTVSKDDCMTQGAGPFNVTIQNRSAGTEPFASPFCMSYTGTTTFGPNEGPTDIFSTRYDLDGGGVTLMAGQQFDVSIQPLVGGRQNFVVTLDTLEADPANDAIFIPNPATPTLKPAGFTLANARLGQAQTISWTRPSFPVASLFINPIVTTSDTGGGSFCSVNQNNPNLDPNATQATFTLPTTCNGQPVQSASFCVFYSAADGRTSTACWFWGF